MLFLLNKIYFAQVTQPILELLHFDTGITDCINKSVQNQTLDSLPVSY